MLLLLHGLLVYAHLLLHGLHATPVHVQQASSMPGRSIRNTAQC